MIRPLFALAATALSLAGCNSTGPAGATGTPTPVASIVPSTATPFDADRSFADLKKQVAFGPRVPGTPGHAACRDWLLAELNTITGGKAFKQDFSVTLSGKKLAMSNIVAQINPTAKKQILFCAHWDTRPTADMEIDPAKKKQPIARRKRRRFGRGLFARGRPPARESSSDRGGSVCVVRRRGLRSRPRSHVSGSQAVGQASRTPQAPSTPS